MPLLRLHVTQPKHVADFVNGRVPKGIWREIYFCLAVAMQYNWRKIDSHIKVIVIPPTILECHRGIGTGLSRIDRKSTRLNSSHANISYAVFCLKKKNKTHCQLFK